MYRNCIFCSADLGTNESIEPFPVGRSLAFDAARGRLWAVCPRCARWNLSPLEERWEAIEAAERLFRDITPARAVRERRACEAARRHAADPGGQAVAGELAAWRYGEQLGGAPAPLPGRRRRHGRGVRGAALGVGGVPAGDRRFWLGAHVWPWLARVGDRRRGAIHRGRLIAADGAAAGHPPLAPARARLQPGADGGVELFLRVHVEVPGAGPACWRRSPRTRW